MFRSFLNRILSFLGLLEYMNPNPGPHVRVGQSEPDKKSRRLGHTRSREKIRAAEEKRERKNRRRAREFYGKEAE